VCIDSCVEITVLPLPVHDFQMLHIIWSTQHCGDADINRHATDHYSIHCVTKPELLPIPLTVMSQSLRRLSSLYPGWGAPGLAAGRSGSTRA
jgi:hypothetical protein